MKYNLIGFTCHPLDGDERVTIKLVNDVDGEVVGRTKYCSFCVPTAGVKAAQRVPLLKEMVIYVVSCVTSPFC